MLRDGYREPSDWESLGSPVRSSARAAGDAKLSMIDATARYNRERRSLRCYGIGRKGREM